MSLAEINSIEQLKKNLNLGPGYGGYIDLLKALNLNKKEWSQYCKWIDDHYSRNCIASCESYELILMCWQDKQASPIHSYNFQEGWIKVLEGKLAIETYEVDRESKSYSLQESLIIEAGDHTYLNDNMGFHKVKNVEGEKTVSLHLHIDRITEWEAFNPDSKTFEIQKPTYDSSNPDCADS